MVDMIMIETPIAFGLTMMVCLALFFYCWRIRKLRHRLTSVQVSFTPQEPAPVEDNVGIKKDIVATFPTVKTWELKVDIKEGLQCPICLLEYGETEVLRELPYCGHVFHIGCVDSWFEKQNTCPVCRIVLTEAPKSPHDFNTRRSSYCRGMPEPTSVTVEMQQAAVMPAWVLVNRPLPLPPAIPENSSLEDISDIEMNHSGSLSNVNGEAPLLRTVRQGDMGGWGAVYLERGPGGLSFRLQNQTETTGPVVNRDCISNHSVSERWTAESFSFGISGGSDDFSSLGIAGSLDSPDTGGQNSGSRASSRGHNHGAWRSDSSKSIRNPNRDSRTSWSSMSTNSSSSDFSNHSPMRHWQMDFGLAAEEVFESPVPSPHHLPLTVSPEHCSFEFLPIITGPGGDYSFRPLKPAAVDRPKRIELYRR